MLIERQRFSRKFASATRVALALTGALMLAGCDTVADSIENFNPFSDKKPYKPEVLNDVPPDQLYNDGLGRMANSDYPAAAKKFAQIDKQYPYTDIARKGLLMTAYTQYQGKQYDEAVTSAKRYIEQNPKSDDAAYAQYLMAMSYYNQITDVARDQDRTEKAAQALQQLITNYPNSEYASDARYKLQVAMDNLAGAQMYVGRFYLEKHQYTAAINRFRQVIAHYQTTRHVEEALERLTEAYFALGVTSEAQTAAAVLGHNFPDSPWYKDAYKLLQTNGLEPREDKGSWLSRAMEGFKSIAAF
ncbi:MAG: outer membrane protein assembly factor BamD [Hyphomicrobiales bacterium]|nr:outer membrane protein assembly factor BamD [Hyphomicrobiales bacterium]MBV8768174.1 outer membrane protein assembly factor BamD [Hyphomicrobiales bacterium]MBV9051187.1 outer membrane protein assembly factor BamD [Hyphomicrobiales bacterium]MBV9138129.1 outer membrane protein assembly factor BamD [Hyphomicrobiales bacterium]MBV9974031.1 outer membrane protein assembly factor BamD [Hyphomicrobiales bacterium]